MNILKCCINAEKQVLETTQLTTAFIQQVSDISLNTNDGSIDLSGVVQNLVSTSESVRDRSPTLIICDTILRGQNEISDMVESELHEVTESLIETTENKDTQ
jgi:hypothetical protein